jgi:hypothetical protein
MQFPLSDQWLTALSPRRIPELALILILGGDDEFTPRPSILKSTCFSGSPRIAAKSIEKIVSATRPLQCGGDSAFNAPLCD